MIPDLNINKCNIEFSGVDFKYETTSEKAVKI